MTVLGLDFGSSSVKAAVLRGSGLVRRVASAAYPTTFSAGRAELSPDRLLKALGEVVARVPGAKDVDVIALSVMAPAWVALDRRGRPLTPIVTHQDRRSVAEARAIEKAVGKTRHLKLAGNRPFPGGISSTTLAWFLRHEPMLMKKAALVGHLNTFLIRVLTGGRVTDPSNASFTGLYRTTTQGGWDDTLIAASGADRATLPDVIQADAIAGRVTKSAATALGLKQGTPVLAGCVDTSAAMLLAGAKPGQLLNVCGSTDVLALCTDKPVPRDDLLTRALGVGDQWMSVSTLAAAGSALEWMQETIFRDFEERTFYRLVRRLARGPLSSGVSVDPAFAGDRTAIEPSAATFAGITLATTREELLSALIDALAVAGAARIERLGANVVKIKSRVITSGGSARLLGPVLQRDWPGRWTFRQEPDATLRGLAVLANT